MKRVMIEAILCVAFAFILSGCARVRGESDGNNDTGPHPATVEPDINADNFKVDHP